MMYTKINESIIKVVQELSTANATDKAAIQSMKKIFRWQNGVEAGIHVDIVPRHGL